MEENNSDLLDAACGSDCGDKMSSLSSGQEEYFENVCSPCMNDGKVSEAIAYCGECQEEFCSMCLRPHKTFKISKDHIVFDATQKDKWGTSKKSYTSGYKCEEHAGEKISMYCKNHSTLCCPVCVSLEHKKCNDMVYIPQIAQGVVKTSEFKTALKDIDEAIADIAKAKKTKKGDQKSIEDSHESAVNNFSKYMKRIYAALKGLEDKMNCDLDASANKTVGDITLQINVLDQMDEILTKVKSDLSINENINEAEFFIKMKMSQKRLYEYGSFLSNCLLPTDPKVMFTENRAFEKVVDNLTTLGTTETKSNFTNKLVKVTKFRKQNIKMANDSETCYIDGLCQMPSGQIIISDKSNKKIKRLDFSYHPVDYCDINGKPYAVCCINEEEIVIALGDTNSLQFVSVGIQLIAKRTLNVGHRCFGLAHHEGILYVSDDSEQKIFVYDLTGSLLRTIYQNDKGLNIFMAVRHLAVSRDGTKLFVTDRNNGLVILDNMGNPERTVNAPILTATRGVCLDNHGNVFLIACSSGNVSQVTADSIYVIADKQHGLVWPGHALFDKMRCCLLITRGPRDGSDFLNICYLN